GRVHDEAYIVRSDCYYLTSALEDRRADQSIQPADAGAVCSAQADAAERYIATRIAAVVAHGGKRCIGVYRERTRRLDADERRPEGRVIVVVDALAHLGRSIGLPGNDAIRSRKSPAAKQVADRPVLLLEDRKLLGEVQPPVVREVQAGNAVFTASHVER